MAFLTRVTDFTPGTLIQSAQVDAELDQFIDILGAGENSKQVEFSHSGSTIGLNVNNSGGGIIQTWEISGVVKIKVNAAGQLESDLTTGTAPFIVDSTTVVANLNAALLGGVAAADFAVTASDETFDNGTDTVLTIQGSASAALVIDDTTHANGEFRLLADEDLLKVQVNDGGWVTIAIFDGTNDQIQDAAGSPLVSVADATAYTTTWSFGVFYAGPIDTGVVQAQWIVPDSVSAMTALEGNWSYQNGTPTGSSTIKVQWMDSAGSEKGTETFTLLIGDSQDTTYQHTFAGSWLTVAGDFFKWTVLTDGGHQDISLQVQGTQTLIT